MNTRWSPLRQPGSTTARPKSTMRLRTSHVQPEHRLHRESRSCPWEHQPARRDRTRTIPSHDVHGPIVVLVVLLPVRKRIRRGQATLNDRGITKPIARPSLLLVMRLLDTQWSQRREKVRSDSVTNFQRPHRHASSLSPPTRGAQQWNSRRHGHQTRSLVTVRSIQHSTDGGPTDAFTDAERGQAAVAAEPSARPG